jgi:hypothetical protein
MAENLHKDLVHAFQQALRESAVKYLPKKKFRKSCRETRLIRLINVSTIF